MKRWVLELCPHQVVWIKSEFVKFLIFVPEQHTHFVYLHTPRIVVAIPCLSLSLNLFNLICQLQNYKAHKLLSKVDSLFGLRVIATTKQFATVRSRKEDRATDAHYTGIFHI